MNSKHRVEEGDKWNVHLEFQGGQARCVRIEALRGGGAEVIITQRRNFSTAGGLTLGTVVKEGHREIFEPLQGYKTQVEIQALYEGGVNVVVKVADGELEQVQDQSETFVLTPYRKPDKSENAATPEAMRLATSLLNVVPAAVDWFEACKHSPDDTLPCHETLRLGRSALSVVKPAVEYCQAKSATPRRQTDDDISVSDVTDLLGSMLAAGTSIYNACYKK